MLRALRALVSSCSVCMDHGAIGIGIGDGVHGDRLLVFGELVDQVFGSACPVSLARHHRAIMPLQPAGVFERLVSALLLDVGQLVEESRTAARILDHQCAESECLTAMRIGDRASRLTIHAGDIAVIGSRIR